MSEDSSFIGTCYPPGYDPVTCEIIEILRSIAYSGDSEKLRIVAKEITKILNKEDRSALNTQHGGDHYKKLGDYQPWLVLKNWLTPEEFRGYMKGTAIAYLAREKDKGGNLDIEKAIHTLQALLELEK